MQDRLVADTQYINCCFNYYGCLTVYTEKSDNFNSCVYFFLPTNFLWRLWTHILETLPPDVALLAIKAMLSKLIYIAR